MTVIKEEKEHTLMSAPHAVGLLTPWEKELEMLEDWLNDLELEDGCQETVM
jgi:hypothetical protein